MWALNRDLAQLLIGDPRGRFMLGLAFLSLLTGLTTIFVLVRRAIR
jgi:Flp pilus assembly protein TadB